MIKHNVVGDVTNPQVEDGVRIIAHCCNDLGIMGAGVAAAIAHKWPQVREQYVKWSKHETMFTGGMLQIVPVDKTLFVANIIGQHGVVGPNNPKPINYEWLFRGMERLASWIQNFRSVKICMGSSFELTKVTLHVPLIGAGLAQGNWELIETLMDIAWAMQEVYIYRLMSDKQVITCAMCGKETDIVTCYFHQGKYIGECCWDERLKATE